MSSITLRLKEGGEGVVNELDADFTAFFRAEYPALVRSLYLVLHDREQARDIAQDAFVQLFARWRRISYYERPEAWVRQVAIRMAVRASRRERRRSAPGARARLRDVP
jgi:DNA-directed RNA polymerase specialized sigma24 family protein